MIDTHAHIFKDTYKEDFEKIIERITDDLDFVVNVAWSAESAKETIEIYSKYKNMLPTVGIHPNHANEVTDKEIKEIETLIQVKGVVALGEIGLDFFRDGYNKERQHYAFRKQLEIARKHNKPVIIHTRSQEAINETIEIIKDFKDVDLLVHSWTGTVNQTRELLKQKNIIFSFNGISTFKNAPEIRELIKEIPIDRFVLETDSPWLSPVPFRGKTNEPSHVKHVYEFIASFLEIDLKEFEKQIDKNARSFYRVK